MNELVKKAAREEIVEDVNRKLIENHKEFQKPWVILVDDNAELRTMDYDNLESMGCRALVAKDYEHFKSLLTGGEVAGARANLYVIDGDIPQSSRVPVNVSPRVTIDLIRSVHPDAKIVLRSGQGYVEQGKAMGVDVRAKGTTRSRIGEIVKDYFFSEV